MIKLFLFVFLVTAGYGCSLISASKSPLTSHFIINTFVRSFQYIYITRKYPHNNKIENKLHIWKANGSVINYLKSDSANVTTFKITFAKEYNIDITTLLKPYNGDYVKKYLTNNGTYFLINNENIKDTVYHRKPEGKINHKFKSKGLQLIYASQMYS